MKNLKYKMIAVACTLMLAACNNDEVAPSGADAPGMARFSATIDGTATRAYDQIWEVNDEIGISVKSGDKTYTNMCYLTEEGNGTFAPKGEKIYFQDDNKVTFTAYYPWNDLPDRATTISADTWRQAEQKKFDFLWAQAEGSKGSPNVAFKFAHKMAKVVLTIKRGDDVSYDEVKAAKLMLEYFKHTGSFDVVAGTAEATGNESAMWEFANNEDKGEEEYNAPFNEDGETVSYTMIFFPQEFEKALSFTATLTGKQSFKADLDFTAANKIIDDKKAKNEWVAGRQYNMGIVLNKTEITVKGCTIDEWKEVSGGNVDAK